MRIVTDIYSQLREDENTILHAYEDHLGYLTIGTGRLIDKRKGGGITEIEADYLLKNDVFKRESQMMLRLPWYGNLSAARRGVLLNMAFQMGVDGMLAFTETLAHVRAGRYDEASRAMLNSRWAQQTPERAQRLAVQMRVDDWQ